MAQALVTSRQLASFIVANRGKDGDTWLRAFDRERNAILRDYRLLTSAVLGLARRPVLARAALTGLSHAPAVFSHLVGVSGGTRSLLPFRAGRV